MDGRAFADLRPGQRDIMKSFARHGADSVYVPSDVMDLRVCWALVERGLLSRFEHEGEFCGYELSAAGRAALDQPQ